MFFTLPSTAFDNISGLLSIISSIGCPARNSQTSLGKGANPTTYNPLNCIHKTMT